MVQQSNWVKLCTRWQAQYSKILDLSYDIGRNWYLEQTTYKTLGKWLDAILHHMRLILGTNQYLATFDKLGKLVYLKQENLIQAADIGKIE